VCSSRRRHTSYKRDWSSDVCSADRTRNTSPKDMARSQGVASMARLASAVKSISKYRKGATLSAAASKFMGLDSRGKTAGSTATRSEERRVGQEGRPSLQGKKTTTTT